METARRSVVKALSWRFIATLITTTLVYAVTGKGSSPPASVWPTPP